VGAREWWWRGVEVVGRRGEREAMAGEGNGFQRGQREKEKDGKEERAGCVRTRLKK
jgi:hypothetical protein